MSALARIVSAGRIARAKLRAGLRTISHPTTRAAPALGRVVGSSDTGLTW
jgi:hypothetical protein